ncbi:MAG TPA: transposase [Polyangiaceae bacterium]
MPEKHQKKGTWGGKREGAGRKPKPGGPGVSHGTRLDHDPRHPVRITLRAAKDVPSLRNPAVFQEIRRAIAETVRAWFRVVHFSVQADHVHLLVEANDKICLSRGITGFSIRVARTINAVLRRSGRVWSDRYDACPLRTPGEVRQGLVDVLMNWKRHVTGAKGLDPCSSAWWFDGWKTPPPLPADWNSDRPPVEPPRTALLRQAWKREGPLSPSDRPQRTPGRLA